MAVRINANGEFLNRTSGLPTSSDFSMHFWFRINTDRNTTGYVILIANAAGTTYNSLYLAADGTSLRSEKTGNTQAVLGLTAGTWYKIGITHTGTTFLTYINGTLQSTHNTGGAYTPAQIVMGSVSGLYPDADYAFLKVWNATLSGTEIDDEGDYADPVRTSNLLAWYEFKNGALTTDSGSNGLNLSSAGTPSYVADPSVPYQSSGYEIDLDAGSYAVTGQAANLLAARNLPTDAGSYAVTGYAATLSKGYALPCDIGSYGITGYAATLTVQRKLACDAGSYLITGQTTGLLVGRKLACDAGSYAMTGNAAALTIARLLSLDAGSYSVSGQTAALIAARRLLLDAGAYSVTSNDATLVYTPLGNYTLDVDAGSYAVTGYASELLVNRKLICDAGSYSTAGEATALAVGRVLVFADGAYTLTGEAIAFLWARVLVADAGSYGVAGNSAGLVWSGEVLPAISGLRTLVVGKAPRTIVPVREDRTITVTRRNSDTVEAVERTVFVPERSRTDIAGG